MNSEILPFISVGIALAGFLFQQFGIIAAMKERLTSLETKTDIFWKVMEGNLVRSLKTYPTFIEKDVLLDKMLKRELKLDEAQQLRTILLGEFGKTKELGYILLLGRLEQLIYALTPQKPKPLWKRIFC